MSELDTAHRLQNFRAEVRAFLKDAVPEDIAQAVSAHVLPNKAQASRWQAILAEKGWGAPGWPVDAGGPGWSLMEQAIFREELGRVHAPHVDNLGLDIIGPTIIRHGTPEQKQTYLPGIISGQVHWAQAYSEPNAGSDLASLRTSAKREGDEWVVNGSKIWQSYGHWCDWALTLVRSDVNATRKQEGMSILLIDLKSPGVTVRPIRYIHGGVLHVEIFFDNVRVPDSQRLGAEHQAWSIAKDLLIVERIFTARAPEARAELIRLAQARRHDGRPVLHSEALRQRFAQIQARVQALESLFWPTLQDLQNGGQPMLLASVIKLEGTLLFQDIHQLWVDAHGLDAIYQVDTALDGVPSAQPGSPDHAENLMPHYWRYRGITMGGGTAEIQRSIMAKALFAGETELDQQEVSDGDDELTAVIDSLQGCLQRNAEADPYAKADAVRELQLHGMCVASDFGGFGLGMESIERVTEIMGDALCQEPLMSQALLLSLNLAQASEFDASEQRLSECAEGKYRLAWAHQEHPDVHVAQASNSRLTPVDGVATLIGEKTMVLGMQGATHLWVSALDDQAQAVLLEVPVDAEGVYVRQRALQDGRVVGRVQFNAVCIGEQQIIARGEAAVELITRQLAGMALLLATDSVGAMRKALQLTLEYLRTRKQFGRSLSEFQVLQHRMADHYRAWMMARAFCRQVASEWEGYTLDECVQRSSAVKWYVNQMSKPMALDVLQLHGAIGLQDEAQVSHYAKHVLDNVLLAGDAQLHEAVMVDYMDIQFGEMS